MYVKLIARPDTWFKEGTEVYGYDSDPERGDFTRVTKEEYEEPYGYFGCRGIHVVTDEIDAKNRNCKLGDEGWDGEWCSKNEFDFVEFVER